MAVIINEFEVVGSDAPERPVQGSQPAARPPETLSPREIAEILRHRAERLARVAAH